MLKWLADTAVAGALIAALFTPVADVSIDEIIYEQSPFATVSVEAYTVGADYLLEPTAFEIFPGENCAEFLVRALDASEIEYTYSGAVDEGFYLQSIDGYGEFTHGPRSGWLYFLNDEMPSYGMTDIFLDEGDWIRLVYTLSWGDDI
ncbi:MAG: DUF4430 domain-containing protein [Clostridia bacterium]|nr:DUF4430 domain-containing protein [Clostridia bacterium]